MKIFNKSIKIFACSILLLALYPAQETRANMTLAVDLETKLQEKLRQQIAPLDSYAQVLVNVRLKKLKVELPGTGSKSAEILSTSSPTSLSVEDIAGIDVTVISTLDPFPESIKKNMDLALQVPESKKHLEFQKLDAATLELVRKASSNLGQTIADGMKEGILTGNNILSKLGLIISIISGGGIFAALVLLLSQIFDRKLKSGQSATLAQIAKYLENSEAMNLSQGQNRPQALSSLPISSGQSNGAIPASPLALDSNHAMERVRELPIESLLALVSDCYWCEEDGYAAWIWSMLSPSLRAQIFEQWEHAREYFTALTHVTPVSRRHHESAYYLNPLNVSGVSQNDLLAFVRENPSMWHSVSPMRQQHFVLPLMERIGLNAGSRSTAIVAPPKGSKEARVFERAITTENIKLTTDDELTIFKQPELIAPSQRVGVPSLAWAALLPRERREALFTKLSAQDLCSIWLGPPEILALIEEVLPAKKKALFAEYKKSVAPDRRSVVMDYVVREATLELNKIEAEKGRHRGVPTGSSSPSSANETNRKAA